MLGVLLHRGEYSSTFLDLVGGDMLDFEREHHSVEGDDIPIWYDTMRDSGRTAHTLRLNWIDGYDANDTAGYDPMSGLMQALQRNPDAAKEFFTSEVLIDGTDMPDGEPGRLSRVDYLLTDRLWLRDFTMDERPSDEANYNTGQNLMGEALEAATTVNPDQRSADIVESIVWETTHDEQARGMDNGDDDTLQPGEFQGTDLIPPSVRDSMGEIMKTWIGDVHNTMTGRQALPSGDVDAVTPGVQRVGAFMDQLDLTRFLADVGKDEGARQTVWDAETAYSAAAYDHHLSDPDLMANSRSERIQEQTAATGRVFGALDFGAAAAGHEQTQNADADYNARVDFGYATAGALIDKGVGIVTARAPVVGQIAGPFIDQVLASAQENAHRDGTAVDNYNLGEMRQNGRTAVQMLAESAVYRNTPVEALPDALVRNGSPIPMSKWHEDEAREWESFVRGPEGPGAGDPNRAAEVAGARTAARDHYNAEYSAAADDLQAWGRD